MKFDEEKSFVELFGKKGDSEIFTVIGTNKGRKVIVKLEVKTKNINAFKMASLMPNFEPLIYGKVIDIKVES